MSTRTDSLADVSHLSDAALLAETSRLAACERIATAQLVASLAELDVRRLYLREGYSSLFTYCTQVLHLSEHAAYGRIEAARAVRRFPAVLDRLADGSLTLTAVRLLAPHLTAGNCGRLLDAARHRSKRDVEAIVAALRPLPPVPSAIRKLPPARRLSRATGVQVLAGPTPLVDASARDQTGVPADVPSVPANERVVLRPAAPPLGATDSSSLARGSSEPCHAACDGVRAPVRPLTPATRASTTPLSAEHYYTEAHLTWCGNLPDRSCESKADTTPSQVSSGTRCSSR